MNKYLLKLYFIYLLDAGHSEVNQRGMNRREKEGKKLHCMFSDKV